MLKFLLVSKDRKYSAESNNKMREELDRRKKRKVGGMQLQGKHVEEVGRDKTQPEEIRSAI